MNGEDVVMCYREAAEFLGISERTLERYVSEGSVPYVRLPQRGERTTIRFLKSELVGWLKRRLVRPARFVRDEESHGN